MTWRTTGPCTIHCTRTRVTAMLCLFVVGTSASCASLSSPGNSAGVCSAIKPNGKGWAYEANEYLIKSVFRNDYVDENGVVYSGRMGSDSRCDTIDREWHTVVKGEYALTVPNNIVFMTASENICRSRPTIHVHRFIEHVWPAKFEAYRFAKESSNTIEPYAELTRPFYVGTHNFMLAHTMLNGYDGPTALRKIFSL